MDKYVTCTQHLIRVFLNHVLLTPRWQKVYIPRPHSEISSRVQFNERRQTNSSSPRRFCTFQRMTTMTTTANESGKSDKKTERKSNVEASVTNDKQLMKMKTRAGKSAIIASTKKREREREREITRQNSNLIRLPVYARVIRAILSISGCATSFQERFYELPLTNGQSFIVVRRARWCRVNGHVGTRAEKNTVREVLRWLRMSRARARGER